MKKFLLAMLVVIFVSLGFVIFHNKNLNSLLSAVEVSETTMELHSKINADAPKETLMRNGSRQYCLGGVEGRECSFDPSIPLNLWIRDYLNVNANSTRDSLLVDKFEIEKVSIFPLFKKLNAAKYLYLEHVDAWEKLLNNRATCSNYEECFNKTDEVSPTFRIANRAFLDALWVLDGNEPEERINRIFKD